MRSIFLTFTNEVWDGVFVVGRVRAEVLKVEDDTALSFPSSKDLSTVHDLRRYKALV